MSSEFHLQSSSPEDSALFLLATLRRHQFSPHPDDLPHQILRRLTPLFRHWAGPGLESVTLSGSYAKGTALRDLSLYPTHPDVDLLLSLSPDSHLPLHHMHASLLDFLTRHSSLVTAPGLQNVSLRVRVDRVAIDLLPARRHQNSRDHSLWQLRRHTWLKTNIDEQIRYVRDSGRTNEIRALKLWRQRQALYCPPTY